MVKSVGFKTYLHLKVKKSARNKEGQLGRAIFRGEKFSDPSRNVVNLHAENYPSEATRVSIKMMYWMLTFFF